MKNSCLIKYKRICANVVDTPRGYKIVKQLENLLTPKMKQLYRNWEDSCK